MALCAVLYLAWWVVFFRPDAGKVQGPLYWIGAGCLVVAAIAGVAGAVFIALGASGLAAGTGPNGWWFALGAIAAYILLAWATAHFWNRPITTELLLFVAWGALELYAACALEEGDPWPYRHMASRCDHLLRVRLVTCLLRSVLPPGRHAVLHSRSASLKRRRHFLDHTAPVVVKQPNRE